MDGRCRVDASGRSSEVEGCGCKLGGVGHRSRDVVSSVGLLKLQPTFCVEVVESCSWTGWPSDGVGVMSIVVVGGKNQFFL